MTQRINGGQPWNKIQETSSRSIQQKPKTDRRFQIFLNEALQEKQQPSSIHVSNHAQKRMEQRGIQLNETDMSRLENAFQTLGEKGAKNSLILYNDLSLIASIQNRTIITASKTAEMTEVTNIDSAIHIHH